MTTTETKPPKKPCIYIAGPHYGSIHPAAAKALYSGEVKGNCDRFDFIIGEMGRSLLAQNFNFLLSAALNLRESQGITHFAMLHSDIGPSRDWIETLYDELIAHDADVLSCVVPLKSNEGLTSTAIDTDARLRSDTNQYRYERRLAMREVMQLPETFTAADCGYPDRALLINTGCWIADIDRVWPRGEKELRHFFTITDRVRANAKGEYQPEVFPEDWNFGRQLHRSGLKVMATRKVRLMHVGTAYHMNDSAWGTLEIDVVNASGPLPALDPNKLALAG
jgi:hypothetical protein